MFEAARREEAGDGATALSWPDSGALTVSAIRDAVEALAVATGPQGIGRDVDAERIDLIRALEDLKNSAAALQSVVTAAFDTSQQAQQRVAGEPSERLGRGVAAQVALARRVSPHRGQQHLSLARILHGELPCTLAAWRSGRITERAATFIARGTTCLSREDRLRVDEQVAADLDAVERLGERGVQSQVAAQAARLDPAAVVDSRRRAETERCVTLRPAPDTMTYLTALLPVAQGVAVFAALTRAADRARATGATRSRGQVMADTLCRSILAPGPAAADDGELEAAPGAPAGVPTGTEVVINLVMTERQLFGVGPNSEGEVFLEGYGLVDADLARQVAALTPADRVWLRRLYAHPTSGELVATDSRRRQFPPGLQRLIRLRDQHCRTPWCRAPIRQGDHALSHARSGSTSLRNGQGLCQACNLAKESAGWTSTPGDTRPGRHRVVTTTPTGHRYATGPPPPPGAGAPRQAVADVVVDMDWLPRMRDAA